MAIDKVSVVKAGLKKAKKVAESKQPVEIIVIADRSGSTENIKTDIIGGFNSFIAEQQQVPGEANVTVVLFDDQYELLQDRVPLKEAVKMSNENFKPRGMTALHDAIGRTINRFRDLHSKGEAQRAIIAVLTDGHENASKEFNGSKVKELVKEVEDKLNWQVLFLAANQDASLTGGVLGVKAVNTLSYAADSAGVLMASAYLSDTTRSYRNAGPLPVVSDDDGSDQKTP